MGVGPYGPLVGGFGYCSGSCNSVGDLRVIEANGGLRGWVLFMRMGLLVSLSSWMNSVGGCKHCLQRGATLGTGLSQPCLHKSKGVGLCQGIGALGGSCHVAGGVSFVNRWQVFFMNRQQISFVNRQQGSFVNRQRVFFVNRQQWLGHLGWVNGA